MLQPARLLDTLQLQLQSSAAAARCLAHTAHVLMGPKCHSHAICSAKSGFCLVLRTGVCVRVMRLIAFSEPIEIIGWHLKGYAKRRSSTRPQQPQYCIVKSLKTVTIRSFKILVSVELQPCEYLVQQRTELHYCCAKSLKAPSSSAQIHQTPECRFDPGRRARPRLKINTLTYVAAQSQLLSLKCCNSG